MGVNMVLPSSNGLASPWEDCGVGAHSLAGGPAWPCPLRILLLELIPHHPAAWR